MARRASSSLHPGIFIGIAAAVVLAVVAGKSLIHPKKTSFGDVSALNMDDFMEDGNSLRGSEYSIEGKIDEKLRWTPTRGQIVSLRVSAKEGNKDSDKFIAIEIPPTFNNLNVEREQLYAMRVKVRQGGIPVATAINRL